MTANYNPRILMLLFFMFVNCRCLIHIGDEYCDRASGCTNPAISGNTVYFGLMLSYSDPLGRKSFGSAFDDGHNIAPAAYLAVEQINNQSDLLSDYQIEIIRLDGGCTVTERTVVGMNRLACSCEPIVGIIGPSCGTSALIVGEFTGRDQFSMVTIHYGERNILGNRTMFPYAFGMLGSNSITIQSFTDLIVQNNWTRIVLLHSEDDIDLEEVSLGIEKNIAATPGYEVAFTSPIYDSFIPLKEIYQSFARVVIVLSSANSTLRIICLAYHERMIFPKYQWIFKERFQDEFMGISFIYEDIQYNCTDSNVKTSILGSINMLWSAVSDENNRTNTDIGLTSTEYDKQYEEFRHKYTDRFGENSNMTAWARGFYDAIWSLAFAVNNSLQENDMNLTQIIPGSEMIAQAIAKHMFAVDFQGISGKINFDNETGINIGGKINVYQFGEKKPKLVGFYTSGKLTIMNDRMPQFIKSTFDEKHVQVSIATAIPFLIITVAALLVAIPIQVINIVYREHKTIKASSPCLNHIIFIGCYLIILGNLLLIITEAWQHTNSPTKSHLCNVIPWFLSVGASMVIGTVCTKTWRLHRIYASSKRVVRLSPKLLSDPALGGVVGVLVAFDVLTCLIWVSVDPLTSVTTAKVQVPSSEELPTIYVTVMCDSEWLIYWSAALIGYKCLITAAAFVLALFTRINKKEFKTINVIVLAYLFAITFGLGVPMYVIVTVINVGIPFRFIILCLLINMIVYICLFALFFPSIIPLVKEKVFHFEDPQLEMLQHSSYIHCVNNKVMTLKFRNSVTSVNHPFNRQTSVLSENHHPLCR